MPGRSFNGTGTRIYGKRDFLSDGSFVTTNWVTFFWVPLFPLSSLRVRPRSDISVPDHFLASVLLAFSTGLVAVKFSERYTIQSKSHPVPLQVFYVYGFVLAFISAWWNLAKNTDYLNAGILCVVLATPFIMRSIARSRATESSPGSVQSDSHEL
jgi:hypothetical protein